MTPHPVGTASSASGSAKVHTAQADHVHVQSVVQTETQSKISMENAKKINDLMSRLGSMHLQIDDYARKRTEEISEAVSEAIKKVIHETQSKQQHLLMDANSRTAEIENEFKLKLQEYVAQIDADKAVLLAQLEKELNTRQEEILENARKRIDDLNEEANRLKMNVLKEAQAQSSAQVNKITEQVVALGHEDASRRLASTTTTVITTKAETASETTPVPTSPSSPLAVGAAHHETKRTSGSSLTSHGDSHHHH